MRRLELEHDNVRAALAYCLEDPDPEPGLQLASAVTRFRFSRGWSKEAADSLLEQLARPEAAAPTLARARALAAAAPQVAAATTDLRLAAELAEESLAIAEAANDDHARADALLTLGWIRIQQDRPDETIELSEQGVALATHAGDEQLQARLLSNLAMAQQDAGVEFRDTLTESVRASTTKLATGAGSRTRWQILAWRRSTTEISRSGASTWRGR